MSNTDIILGIFILPLTKSQQKLMGGGFFSVIKEIETFERESVLICKIKALKFFKN